MNVLRGSAEQRIADRVLARIGGAGAELAALTSALVAVPTLNPPGDAYRPCAELIGERLRRRGLTVAYLRAEGAVADSDAHPRVNVVARAEGAGPGPCVHFNGHIDVVAAGSGWTVDPFAGLIRDGRVWGRGACDMKGGLAAAIIAVEAILDEGVAFPGALEVSGTVDEESGGYAGVAWLAERGWLGPPKVDHVIIPEPLGVDRICLGHRGVWWGEIETRGRIAHGSMPFLGRSAIRDMGRVLAALEDRLLPRLAARRTAMPVEPPGARASTLNLNSIHGGAPEPGDGLPAAVVADRCRIVVDRRFPIEETADAARDEILALLDEARAESPGLEVGVRELFRVEPSLAPADGPLVRALAAALGQVRGVRPALIASPGTYDQKHVTRIGRLNSCVAYGPGVLDLAHQPDEWVAIDDMVAAAQVMALAALTLTGACATR